MPSSLFLVNQLREKFLRRNPLPLNTALSQTILDIEEKTRSNLFSWRGQFSPQLVEHLILAYAPHNATILIIGIQLSYWVGMSLKLLNLK